MTETGVLPRKLMLQIAATQGIALVLVHLATVVIDGPGERLVVALPLWTAAVIAPVLMLMAVERGNERRVLKLVASYTLVLVLLAVYVGWQAEPQRRFPTAMLTLTFAYSVALASFKALMYLQQRAAGRRLDYRALFTDSWRNFLTGALALVFVGIFWALLLLWGELFHVIGIDFFRDLFRRSWFYLPALSLAFGTGVIVFRGLIRVIDGIAGLLQGLIKLLLPLTVGIAVLFLGSLPFVGLEPLWSTGHGTALLLWLLALLLFFTNAVYQDGRGEPPYPLAVHRAIYLGLFSAPLLSALSLYGLWLRVDQYGWSVERCWAFLVWLLLTLFAVGYVAGILRRRDEWTGDLARVNTAMGLVVLALMLLVNSPLLDFRKISLSSQLDRVESGEIGLRDLDYFYLHRNLGRPGHLAIEDIKARVGDSDPELLAMLEAPVFPARRLRDPGVFWDELRYRPAPFALPADLRELIGRDHAVLYDRFEPWLIRSDLDGDGEYEYALIQLTGEALAGATLYYRTATGWARSTMQPDYRVLRGGRDFAESVRTGDIARSPRRFDDLRLGDLTWRVLEPPVPGQSPGELPD